MLVFLIALNTVLSFALGAALAVLFDLRHLVPQKVPEITAPQAQPLQRAAEADDDDPGALDSTEAKPSTPRSYNW